jgi:hemerythrin superfamily protein
MAGHENCDLLDEVLEDHDEIKKLFAKVEASTGDAKRDAFEDLVRKLAVHETAEQEVVHPLLRNAGGEEIVEKRLTEEKEGEKMLAELLKMGTGDPTFDRTFATLRGAVLEHADHEQEQEHPKIREKVDEERLRKLAKVFRTAELAAPTRPHPLGPTSAAGNLAVGPVVAIMDRARDAVREAMHKLSA